jgi:hypothetical protein
MSRDYNALARAELLAEDAAKFEVRVKLRATALREQDRQIAEGMANFPSDPAAAKTRLDEFVAEKAALDAKRPWERSAAGDQRGDWLKSQIHELAKRCRQLGVAA